MLELINLESSIDLNKKQTGKVIGGFFNFDSILNSGDDYEYARDQYEKGFVPCGDFYCNRQTGELGGSREMQFGSTLIAHLG